MNNRCDICFNRFYETKELDGKKICILYNVLNRCIKCNVIVYPENLFKNCCFTCWNKSCYISTILPNELYLSDYKSSINYPLLLNHGIKQILTIGRELPTHKTNLFKTMHIWLDDLPEELISRYFSPCHSFIAQAPTLVHCYAGISRSSTIVISYLIKHKDFTLKNALEHCRNIRPIVNPNIGFLNQLESYEKDNFTRDSNEEIFQLEIN